MTLPSAFTSRLVELPEAAESELVRQALQVEQTVKRLGLPRQLLTARIAWDRLLGDTYRPGAPSPSVAKSLLTRDAQRRHRLARSRRRQQLYKLLSPDHAGR